MIRICLFIYFYNCIYIYIVILEKIEYEYGILKIVPFQHFFEHSTFDLVYYMYSDIVYVWICVLIAVIQIQWESFARKHWNTRHQPQVAGTHLWKWLGPSPVLYAPRAGMLWDGVRLNPNDLATINAGGCPVTDALLVPANVPRKLDGGWGVMVQGLGLERIHISYCSSLLEKALSVPSHCLPRQLPFLPPDGPMVPWPLNAFLSTTVPVPTATWSHLGKTQA